MWSLGASITVDGRKPFDLFCKRLLGNDIAEHKRDKKLAIPEKSLYDFCYRMKENGSDGEWVTW